MTTTTAAAKQIRRYIGGTDMLCLAEAGGAIWASNRIWLVRAGHVQPFLDKHGIEGTGGWEINGRDVRLFSKPPDVAQFLNILDYTVDLKNATIGDFEAAYVLTDVPDGEHYCVVLVNPDGSRYMAVRADYLHWLEDAPVTAVSPHGGEMRLATTEHPNGPIAIIADTWDPDGNVAGSEIAAVVKPIRRAGPEDAHHPTRECHDAECGHVDPDIIHIDH